jgi:hypothetical protein
MADGESEMGQMRLLGAYAIGLVSLAAIDLTGIAVVTQYKSTGLVDNTTANQFITGLAIFGAFVGVLAISVIGKVIVGLFRKGM